MALADALAPIYARARRAARPICAARSTMSPDLWRTAQRKRPPARRERAAAPMAVGGADAGCGEPALKADLHWIPDPAASYVTARVVADAGGVYARAVLLVGRPQPRHPQGPDRARRARAGRAGHRGRRAHRARAADHRHQQPHSGHPGSAAGRAPSWSAPTGRGRACMYWPEGRAGGGRARRDQRRGQRVSRRPAGRHRALLGDHGAPEVEPAAQLDQLEVVRIFDYGLHGIAAAGSRPARACRPPTGGADGRGSTSSPASARGRPLAPAGHRARAAASRRHHRLLLLLAPAPRSGCRGRRRC